MSKKEISFKRRLFCTLKVITYIQAILRSFSSSKNNFESSKVCVMCALKLKTFQQLKVNKSHTLPKRGMVGMQMCQPTFGWYLLFSTQSKKFLKSFKSLDTFKIT